jgi:hypothetical protein
LDTSFSNSTVRDCKQGRSRRRSARRLAFTYHHMGSVDLSLGLLHCPITVHLQLLRNMLKQLTREIDGEFETRGPSLRMAFPLDDLLTLVRARRAVAEGSIPNSMPFSLSRKKSTHLGRYKASPQMQSLALKGAAVLGKVHHKAAVTGGDMGATSLTGQSVPDGESRREVEGNILDDKL